MEKTIEKIWKEGFTNNSLLAIPKIKDLDSLESIYFIDKFKKMYKTNIIVLTLTGILVLFAFIAGGVPFIGIFLFGLFAFLAIMGQQELNRLNELNIGATSYEYLKAFDHWLNHLLDRFSRIYSIWVPLFLSLIHI